MAAALPGVVASLTAKPVIGIPLSGAKLDGLDALLSIVQMPSGMPVATVAVDGAKNGALLAVQIGAVSDPALAENTKPIGKIWRSRSTKKTRSSRKSWADDPRLLQ